MSCVTTARTRLLLRGLEALSREAPRQADVYRRQVLGDPPADTHALAAEAHTSCDNIRMAKSRACRFMRTNVGDWADDLDQAVKDESLHELDAALTSCGPG